MTNGTLLRGWTTLPLSLLARGETTPMIDQSTPVGVGPNSYSFYSYCWGYDACCPETAGVPVDFEGRRASSTIRRGGREWGLTVGRELILPQSEEELLHDWNRRLATYYIYEILLFRWECKEFVWNKSNEMIRKPRVKSCLRRKSSVAWFRK